MWFHFVRAIPLYARAAEYQDGSERHRLALLPPFAVFIGTVQ